MTGKSINKILEEKIKALENENAELRKKEECFRSIAEKSRSAILILEQETILYTNPAWAEMHQILPEEAVNKTIGDFSPPNLSQIDIRKTFAQTNSPEMIHFIESAIESGRLPPHSEMRTRRMNNTPEPSSEGLLMQKNGEFRWMQIDSSLIPYNGKQVVLNIERDVTEQVLSEQKLKESEERYRALFEQTIVCIVLMGENGEHIFNKNVHEILGYTKEEFEKITIKETEAIKNKTEVDEHHRKIIAEGKPETFETKLKHKNGQLIDMLINITPLKIGGKDYLQNVSIDITDRKRAEEMLKKSNEKLEKRVEERTEELKRKSDSLEETNTALKVLLKRREEDKDELQDNVLSNIQDLVLPSIEKLKKTMLNTSQKLHINILESNFKDVASPFLHRLSMKHLKFTPSEIQISNLIKQGRTTKEIADYLNLSTKTVEFHRNSIRKKLGLNNVKANLRTHLLSLN